MVRTEQPSHGAQRADQRREDAAMQMHSQNPDLALSIRRGALTAESTMQEHGDRAVAAMHGALVAGRMAAQQQAQRLMGACGALASSLFPQLPADRNCVGRGPMDAVSKKNSGLAMHSLSIRHAGRGGDDVPHVGEPASHSLYPRGHDSSPCSSGATSPCSAPMQGPGPASARLLQWPGRILALASLSAASISAAQLGNRTSGHPGSTSDPTQHHAQPDHTGHTSSAHGGSTAGTFSTAVLDGRSPPSMAFLPYDTPLPPAASVSGLPFDQVLPPPTSANRLPFQQMPLQPLAPSSSLPFNQMPLPPPALLKTTPFDPVAPYGGSAAGTSKAELGRATWTLLHTLAAQLPDQPTRQQQRDTRHLVDLLTRVYPCGECASHFKEIVRRDPPAVSTGAEFRSWLCRTHNIVNRSIGKPTFNCDLLAARWAPLDCGSGAGEAATNGCDMQLGRKAPAAAAGARRGW